MAALQFPPPATHLPFAFFFFSLEINGTDEGQSQSFRAQSTVHPPWQLYLEMFQEPLSSFMDPGYPIPKYLGPFCQLKKNGGSCFSITH